MTPPRHPGRIRGALAVIGALALAALMVSSVLHSAGDLEATVAQINAGLEAE